MQNNILVYSYRRCPFAMRVRIALHEKKIPFETQEEDLKNFSTELRALHPEAKVPVLVHGGRVIYESAIINEYVDELESQEAKLMPSDAAEKAEVRLWTYWCNTVFKPDLDRFKYGTSRFSEKDCEGAEERLQGHLKKLEKALQSASWLVGNRYSLAEVNLFPFVRQLFRIQPTPSFISQFPRLVLWSEGISTRESVHQALAISLI